MEEETKSIKSRFPCFSTIILIFLIVLVGFLVSVIILQNRKIAPKKSNKEVSLVESKSAKEIFGNLSNSEKQSADDLIREQIRLIVSRPQFFSSLEVVEKNEQTITQEAEKQQIPKEVALGMAMLENGGSESAVSSAGAAGIFQITEGTAKQLGLEVTDEKDERLDPQKNIAAGISYLNENLKLFSDIGLAVWAYHAGPQNVSVALKTYLQSIGEKDAYSYTEALQEGLLDRAKYVWRAYVTKGEINVHQILQNPKVQLEALAGLTDETELYPYKVAASSIIWDAKSKYSTDNGFKQKIKEFNQGKILLSELLTPIKAKK